MSRLDEARSEILITRAEGEALRELSGLYSMIWREGDLSARGQQRFLRASVYSARGTLGAFWGSVRAWFYDQESILSSVQMVTGAEPYIETPEASGLYISRMVEVSISGSQSLHYITRRDGDRLYLSPARGVPYLSREIRSGAGSARVLPWIIEEPQPSSRAEEARSITEPATVRLLFSSSLAGVPPTYLREDGDPRDTANGEPFGGHLMDYLGATPYGSQISGPFPLYFSGDEGSYLFAILDPLLASGVHLEIGFLEDHDPEEGAGGGAFVGP